MQAEMESKKKKALEAEEELAALRAEKESRAPEMQLVGVIMSIVSCVMEGWWQGTGRGSNSAVLEKGQAGRLVKRCTGDGVAVLSRPGLLKAREQERGSA